MKYRTVWKILAILLATCALTAALGSILGVGLLANSGLYTQSYETWEARYIEDRLSGLATAVTESYVARTYSDLTDQELAVMNWGKSWQQIGERYDLTLGTWAYTIAQGGSVRETTYTTAIQGAASYTFQLQVNYPRRASERGIWDARYDYHNGWVESAFYVRYDTSDTYHVTLWLQDAAVASYNGMDLDTVKFLVTYRYHFIACLAASILVFGLCLVYLCFAAGKRYPGDQPQPTGLNRLPLDLYALAVTLLSFGAAGITIELVEEFIFYSPGINWGWLTLGVLAVLLGSLEIVGFVFALAAQLKLPKAYAWRHTLLGYCLGKLWKGIRFAFAMLCKLIGLLPLVWKYLLIALAMTVVPLSCLAMARQSYGFGSDLWALVFLGSIGMDIALVCYGAFAYGTLLKGAGDMAKGQLQTKIPTEKLRGAYRQCAENLNTLADVAVEAARQQTRSDRMKTELITNISHDIKTPLTSIINYVDLLPQAQTEEEKSQYLQVLDRQAQKLKKLIEDLMEMSKATTGDMAVEITSLDVGEAVNQALGEFSDKLQQQDLTVVLQQAATPQPILADGRLLWRVLSNLLSNVVKYALPGTRVYVDLNQERDVTRLSIKNISREALNISAEELTERFVRGDASRNTEGSGLGLNIAKSLMELQKGSLVLTVDGDLFKATLTFPTKNQ